MRLRWTDKDLVALADDQDSGLFPQIGRGICQGPFHGSYAEHLLRSTVLGQQPLGDVALLRFGHRAHEWIKVTNPATARVIARITGRVQGVNYRATAKREAVQRGLRGWVRNEPDGSVLIDVEGEPSAVDAFLAWCAEGPPQARVAAVETTSADPFGYEEFTIQRSQRR